LFASVQATAALGIGAMLVAIPATYQAGLSPTGKALSTSVSAESAAEAFDLAAAAAAAAEGTGDRSGQ
jgi:hypothetical protein